jgi:hypothetical protein
MAVHPHRVRRLRLLVGTPPAGKASEDGGHARWRPAALVASELFNCFGVTNR